MLKKSAFLTSLAAGAAMLAATSAPGFAADKTTLAFVVNGASDFWKAAEAGDAFRRFRHGCSRHLRLLVVGRDVFR